MAFPERFSNLPDYAFPRLRALLDTHAPGGEPIAMTIGEPKHPHARFVGEVIAANLDGFGVYPPNDGTPELLAANAAWLTRRYGDRDRAGADHGAERHARGAVQRGHRAVPRKQERQAARRSDAEPLLPGLCGCGLGGGGRALSTFRQLQPTGSCRIIGALDPALLDRTAIVYLCSPANPQGAVASRDYWAELLALAEQHDFIVLADECYSEIWRRHRPPGVLQVAAETGADPERVFAFHSLSKRSNLPGLRSGFVAGGPKGIAQMRKLRAFAGAPVPLPLQKVAERAWDDEAHVEASRALYQQKFADAAEVFAGLQGFDLPEGGFFLWLPVEDGEAATLKLWRETGVRVLPGAYLSREVGGQNPGKGYIRVALVAPRDETQRGLTRLRDCLYA